MRRPVGAGLATALLGAAALTGCGAGEEQGEVTLRVLAAASLTEVFTVLGDRFEADNPGTRVELSFGPSSGLAEQVGSGAPADVFASASPTTMQVVLDRGEVVDPQDFASNRAAIAVPTGTGAAVSSLGDLADPGVKVAVCDPEVPCGVLAEEVLGAAGLDVTPVTEEEDVKAVLTKVTLGEVDAGLVYATDVRAAAGDVAGIEVPPGVAASTTYPVARLTGSDHPAQAQAFVDLVLSREGRSVLRDAGFGLP